MQNMQIGPKFEHLFAGIIRIVSILLDLIYPRFCLLCLKKINSASEYNICSLCALTIKPIKPPFCVKCGTVLKQISQIRNNGCSKCTNKKYYFDQALSACKYQGSIKTLLHLFKYKHKIKTGNFLADILIKFITDNLDINNIDLILAVPLHKHKFRERGFNQAQVLANRIGIKLGIRNSVNNLCRIKKTTSQVKLTADKRRNNTLGAFISKKPEEFKDKRILLIDDIFTTGSTINQCARILKQSKAARITCLTIAR